MLRSASGTVGLRPQGGHERAHSSVPARSNVNTLLTPRVVKVPLTLVEIADSARKHGISESSIIHAWENAIKLAEFEYDGEDRLFVIGPDSSGNLLELVAVPVEDPTRIIHADRLRPRFYDAL